MGKELHTTQPASAVCSWETILRADPTLKFTRVVPWDSGGLWLVEFAAASGRLCRDIVIEADGSVWTKEDADV